MASVYQRTYVDKHGKRRRCSTYTVEAKVGDTFERVPGFRDRKASEELGRRVERLANLRAGGEQPDATLSAWLQGLPVKQRDRLAELGLVSGESAAATRKLTDHLADYHRALLDGVASPKQKGPATAKHADLVKHRAQTLLTGIGATFLADVTAEAVGRYLTDRKDTGKLSVQTANNYVKDGKAFFNWLVRSKRAIRNPIASVGKQQVTARVRKHVRRALEPAEAAALLDATRDGPESFGMDGESRYWLYRLALETALRSGELRKLTPDNFRLDDAEPYVYLPGDDTKNRQEAELPLRAETVAELRELLCDRAADRPLFDMPRDDLVVHMLRADLKRTGIPYETASGVADFHSLRGTCLTWLAAANVPLKTLQTFARHCTPTLTMNVYARTLHGSLADAASRLPDLSSQPSRERQRKSGTYDTPVDAGGGRVPTGGRTGGNAARISANTCAGVPSPASAARPAASCGSAGFSAEKSRPLTHTDALASIESNLGVSGRLVGPAAFKAAGDDSEHAQTQALSDIAGSDWWTDCGKTLRNDADFAAVAAAWSGLPVHIRAAVLALVQSATGGAS